MNLASSHSASSLAQTAAVLPAKPLRIAVLLGDAVDLAVHSATILSQLEKVQICALDAALPNIDESALQAPASITSLLGQATIAIEQGNLVELSFNEDGQPHRLYLLDGLSAAKLRLHAHAFIAGFAAGTEATHVTDRALTAAKRNQAHSVQHTIITDTLNEAFVALRQGVTALAARTQAPLHGTMNTIDTNGTSDTHHHNGYWFSGQHQARVLCLNLVTKSFVTTNPITKSSLAKSATKASHQADASQASCPQDTSLQDASGPYRYQSLVLTQGTQLAPAKALVDETRLLVPISGDTLESLSAQVSQLVTTLENCDFRAEQLTPWFERYHGAAPLALVLMATSADLLQLEAKAMLTALESEATRLHGQAFKTPAGSCFTPKPLGNNGLTFVYPGVGTVYANMLNNLHEYFPALYHQLEREGDLSAMLQAPLIYAADVKTAANMSLSQQAISGVGTSYLFTKLLTQVFCIQPKLALGYSMGEAAMWASLDVWQTPHKMINATENSDIFNHAISGELTAVRRAWQLSQDEPIVWNSFVVRADSKDIQAVLADFPRAYLAITQGDTCVLAGCEASCKALLAHIGKRGIAANRVTAMHTAPAMLVHGQVQDFYTQALKPEALKAAAQDSSIRFISAAQTAPVTVDSTSIARAIANTFCAPLDFSALIHNACDHGANLFVEVGADRQTCTLIDKISHAHHANQQAPSQQQPVVATACNAKGADTVISLLKCLAQLISHRVPLSLAPLMPHLSSEVLPKGEPQ